MSSTNKSIKRFSKMQLGEVRRLNGLAEARQQRATSTAFRREIHEEKKNIANYQSEYDRIRAHLNDTAIPFQTREGLRTRTEHLKALGALAVSGIA